MISIIIRTKNEERWIGQVLASIHNQDFKDFEIIIVDNKSADKTLEKAANFNVKMLTINDYLPGKALNYGIKASKGEYIVCISAHCIPVNNRWLGTLIGNFYSNNDVAGVYGRQEPMSFTSDFDKRDLLITFGLDKRVQIKDSFFHNANSMIRRDVWEKYPFDDKVSNIEDRVWAKKIIDKGYKIIYEPEASVYHYHGIHQNADKARCQGVINVLENIESLKIADKHEIVKKKEVVAFIPVKGEIQYLNRRPLLEYTIEHAKNSKYIKKIFVLTDNEKTKLIAEKLGACVPFLRKAKNEESLQHVLKESLERIECRKIYPDVVAIMWVTFPFREKNYIDKLVLELFNKGFDSVISARPVYETCWQEKEKGRFYKLASANLPRARRKKFFIGIEGLGYVTYPDCIRNNRIYEDNIGIIEVHNPVSAVKVREKEDFIFAENIAKEWFKKDKCR